MRCRMIRSGDCSATSATRSHETCLAVMYACGLRIGEATTLEIGAVDRANQVLRIIGKGDKERLVPLPQPVLDELGPCGGPIATRAGCSPTAAGTRRSTTRAVAYLRRRR